MDVEKAIEFLVSSQASFASSQASFASNQASFASSQASIASNQASIASSQASIAANQAAGLERLTRLEDVVAILAGSVDKLADNIDRVDSAVVSLAENIAGANRQSGDRQFAQ